MIDKKQSKIKEAVENAKLQLKELTGFEAVSVTSIKKDGEEWVIAVEMLEKKGIPDRMDILGLYEVRMDNTGGLLSYDRKGLRKRGDTGTQEVESEE